MIHPNYVKESKIFKIRINNMSYMGLFDSGNKPFELIKNSSKGVTSFYLSERNGCKEYVSIKSIICRERIYSQLGINHYVET